MAEDEKDNELEPGQKKVEVDATATVSDETGPTHEVEVTAEATVTPIGDSPGVQAQIDEAVAAKEQEIADWLANSPVEQIRASAGATENRAKAAAGAAGGTRSQFSQSGRVD